ncbi:MAG: methylenetetrahydrofolate reductase [NAD(P)H] [Planctomycetota bacterium]|nr:methylenetetrahydrofolate reductase [NAD(P)H] [Planctomycetota bacterium]
MKIADLYGQGRPVFSFEFFPPKTDQAAEDLYEAVAELKERYHPDFISVTYGAGGSTRERGISVSERIQRELGLNVLAHLTCTDHSASDLDRVIDELVGNGVNNILALRGDAPAGSAKFVPHPKGFSHATELMAHLRGRKDIGSTIGIGGACYPENHPESKNAADDMKWTLAKQEAGAEYLISQLFFDNDDYFASIERGRAAGLTIPIIPGIMPITSVGQVERFTKMCGAKIPDELMSRLDKRRGQRGRVMAIGIEWAIDQCVDLLERGVPGIHFYTLNKSEATRTILAGIHAGLRSAEF